MTRPIDAEDWIAGQPNAARAVGEARAEELIREVTLREVRAAVKQAQVEVAAAMDVTQDRVSKLEHGRDALVSTLRRHARALGGELKLTIEFPDRPPVVVDLDGRRPKAAHGRSTLVVSS